MSGYFCDDISTDTCILPSQYPELDMISVSSPSKRAAKFACIYQPSVIMLEDERQDSINQPKPYFPATTSWNQFGKIQILIRAVLGPCQDGPGRGTRVDVRSERRWGPPMRPPGLHLHHFRISSRLVQMPRAVQNTRSTLACQGCHICVGRREAGGLPYCVRQGKKPSLGNFGGNQTATKRWAPVPADASLL